MLRFSITWIIGFVVVIWAVEVVNTSLGHSLSAWGIVPRNMRGLIGIPLAPFLHGSLVHVFSNTVPFLVLGGLVALQGKQRFLAVSAFIILIGGLGVWVVGRPAVHIGASGLVFGYFGYLVARGWYDRSFGAILIAVAVLFLYGGLLFGVIPTIGFVSWEAHLFGLIAGVLAARITRRERVIAEQPDSAS